METGKKDSLKQEYCKKIIQAVKKKLDEQLIEN